MKIDVLGTEYTVCEKSESEDNALETCDGYCDKTTKTIVITQKSKVCSLGDFEVFRKKLLRHEIIHAFLFESGLHENWKHDNFGHDETMIDWVAVQFPKMQKCFEMAGCL